MFFSLLSEAHFFRQRVEKSHRNTHKKRGLFQREGSISGLAFSDTFPSLYSLGFTKPREYEQLSIATT
jgi:hypothetical protein